MFKELFVLKSCLFYKLFGVLVHQGCVFKPYLVVGYLRRTVKSGHPTTFSHGCAKRGPWQVPWRPVSVLCA